MAPNDGAKRAKARPRPPHLQHKRLGDAYLADLVSLAELLRFVHSWGQGDAAVAWVASRQLALITVPQLHVAGVGRGGVRRRRENGSLHPMYRGVYLVGHPVPPPGALELGAVLACGKRTLVSHRSAAALFGLAAPPPDGVEVTVIARGCRSRAGLRVHQAETLATVDRGSCHGIPVTAPARTLIDYAATAGYEEAERAIAEAFALKLLTEPRLTAAIDRAPHRAGVAQVKAILGQEGGPSRTRSGGERAMLRLIRAAGLPEPRTNYPVAGFTADFCWPDERLIVEVDGHPFHSSRPAVERDHRRDLVHREAGYEVIRFTARQLEEAPFYVAAVIARALDRRSRSRGLGRR
jgi:very-short-patch-repair endonuclease